MKRNGRFPVLMVILMFGVAGAAPVAASDTGTPGMASVSDFAGNRSSLVSETGQATGSTLISAPRVAIDAGLSFAAILLNRSAGIFEEMREAEAKQGSGGFGAAWGANGDSLRRFWVKGFGASVERGDRGSAPGYVYDASGAALGYDRVLGNFFGGLGLSYAGGGLSTRYVDGDSRLDSYNFNVYGGYRHRSGFFSKALAGYGYGDERLENAGGRGSRYRGNTWTVGNVSGLELPFGPFTLIPSIGLIHQEAASAASIATTGAMGEPHAQTGTSSLIMPLDLALRYHTEIGPDSSLAFRVNGGYSRQFRTDASAGTMAIADDGGNSVSFRGLTPARDALLLGTGVRYQYKRFEFDAAYGYDGTKIPENHLVNGVIGIRF